MTNSSMLLISSIRCLCERMRVQRWISHGLIMTLFLVVLNAHSATAVDKLRVVYQWTELDYAWPDDATKKLFSHYVREKNNPMGVAIADDRLFITVPRWDAGVAATLNYIYLNDTSESPLLNPYPNWEAHRYDNNSIPEVVSVFRVWADRCNRLWVLDRGAEGREDDQVQVVPPTLLIYDLTNDQLLRHYVIPTEQTVANSHFANVVVEDSSCEDSFAYLADIRNPSIVVYSWARNDSWLVWHHYFHADPLAGNFNVSGLSVQWWDGVVNLGLAPQEDGYSTLYFHPLCSHAEFSVSTQVLRDPELATSSSNFHEFTYLGTRGSNGQGAASYLDPTSGILFHALSISNAIACWNPATSYEAKNVGRVYADNTTLVFPGDIKIDNQSNIWVLSNRLPTFMYDELDHDDYNYRILTGSVKEAVAGTVCSRGTLTYQTDGFLSIILGILVLAIEHGQKFLKTYQ